MGQLRSCLLDSSTASMSAPFDFPALAEAAFNYPAIDNHAHPLLTEIHRNLFSFDGLLSEARGDALRESVNTLASFRATRQLSKLFECEDDWDTVKECRARLGYDELCNRCFEKIGIYCILLDNGLDGERITEEVGWHDRFAKAPSKQIVRIETSAQVRLHHHSSIPRPFTRHIIMNHLGHPRPNSNQHYLRACR